LAANSIVALSPGKADRLQSPELSSGTDVSSSVLAGSRDTTCSKAKFVRIDDHDFLPKLGIEEAIPFALLKGNDDHMMSIPQDRAEPAELRYRPLAVTVRDALAYHAIAD
jgi:hypothetical protein